MAAKKIWALLDDRQGNTNQTLGVAEALGLPFETKQLAFNPLVRLPNPLIYHSTIGIAPESRALLTPPWPDVVISTARRLGLVASYIKHKSPSTFLLQIQWPGFPASHFDLIAAPLHDGIGESRNVITTLGAPHRVTQAMLKQEAARWQPQLAACPAPRIALLVGGSTRARDFADKHAARLARYSSDLAGRLGGSLLVTTSRRTGSDATAVIRQNITCPHYIYAWDDNAPASANPFYGLLGMADAVIATGDSISMCSEACATGKPVFIYASDDFMSAKHRLFVKELFSRRLAKPLNEKTQELCMAPGALNDAGSVVYEAKRRLSL